MRLSRGLLLLVTAMALGCSYDLRRPSVRDAIASRPTPSDMSTAQYASAPSGLPGTGAAGDSPAPIGAHGGSGAPPPAGTGGAGGGKAGSGGGATFELMPTWYEDGGATFLELREGVIVMTADGRRAAGANFNGSAKAMLWTDSAQGPAQTDLGVVDSLHGVTVPTAISADGTTVVGTAVTGGFSARLQPEQAAMGQEAVLWTATRGLLALGFMPGYDASSAVAVSRDGAIVVGTSGKTSRGRMRPAVAFIWTETAGFRGLPPLPGDSNSWAMTATPDASIVIGISENETSGEVQLVSWAGNQPPVALEGTRIGASWSEAGASVFVSNDGSVVAATAVTQGLMGPAKLEAVRWTAGTGMIRLGFAPGETDSAVVGLSADGSVIVGVGDPGRAPFLFQPTGFEWTAAGGRKPLFAGWVPSVVNRDASIIAGGVQVCKGSSFSFGASYGVRELFEGAEIFRRRCNCIWITATSDDGKTLGGSCQPGDGTEHGWIARLPGP